MRECKNKCLLDLEGVSEMGARPQYRLVWSCVHSERALVTSSIEAKAKASHLLTELRAKETAFQIHIEAMQPIHDELIMEQGLHAMAIKPVLK